MTRRLRSAISLAVLTTAIALLAPAGATAKPEPRGHATPPSTSSSTLSRAETTALRAALREAWADLPGGAIATVIVPGRGRWVGTVGYADVERRRPLRPEMQSHIGSVSKTFTAMLVLQQVAAGRLRLDDRLDRWYPEIPKSDEITVAMLLNMSSGIGDYLNTNVLGYAEELLADPKRQYDPDALIARGAALPREFDVPGTGFAYSNTNTVLLGRILEKATGRSYASLLRKHLTKPLKMPRTFVDVAGRMKAPYAQNYSDIFAYIPPGDDPSVGRTTGWGQSVVWSAGGLASTIGDLGRWGRTLGTGKGAIPKRLAQQRLTDCSPPATEGPDITVAYCLGLIVVRDTDSGRPITLWHNGRVFGAVAYVGYYPATGAVVAVMGTSDMSGPDGEAISMRGKELIEAAVPGLLGL